MGLWIFIGIGVLVFIIGDAFGDWSFKISGFWKRRVQPVVGRVGTRVRDAVLGTHPARSTWDGQAPAARKIDWDAIGAFIWKAKWLILIVLLFAFVIAGAQGCVPFGDWGKSRDTIRAERDLAESEADTQETINERDVDLAAIRQDVALLRRDLRYERERGRNDLAAATPEHEEPLDPGLVAVWRANLDRLCVPRHPDEPSADSCRP